MMRNVRFYVRALSAVLAFCTAISAAPSSWEPRVVQHREAYPQVYDCQGDTQTNLYASTAFKTRHSRFFTELADSMRMLENSLSDTLGKKYMVIFLRVGSSGKVDSAAVAGCDSIQDSALSALQARLCSWHFANAAQQRLIVLQDLNVQQKYTKSFYQRNRTKVWIGAIILAALIFFL